MPKRSLDWDADDDERPRRRSRRDDDDDDDERPKKRRPRRTPPPKSRFPFILLGVGGGVAALVVGAVVLLPFLNRRGAAGPNANGAMNTTPTLPVSVSPKVRPPLPPGWVDFKHPDCGASIYCPEPMYPDPSNSKEAFGTPLASPDRRISKGFHTVGGAFTCGLLVSEHHPQLSADARQKVLKDWTVYGSHPTFWFNAIWAGHPAKKVSGARADTQALEVSHRVWVGDRFYMATISGTFGHPTPAEQATFFDSFVLKE